MKKKMIIIIPLIFFLFGMVGCDDDVLYHEFNATYSHLEENSAFAYIDVSFEQLHGEIIYSFMVTEKEYKFSYEINIEDGDLNIEVRDYDGEVLEETGWFSVKEGNLNIDINEQTNLQGVGGIMMVTNESDRIMIVIDGIEATGTVKVKW